MAKRHNQAYIANVQVSSTGNTFQKEVFYSKVRAYGNSYAVRPLLALHPCGSARRSALVA